MIAYKEEDRDRDQPDESSDLGEPDIDICIVACFAGFVFGVFVGVYFF